MSYLRESIVAIGSLEEKIATLMETKHEIQKKLAKLQPVTLSPTRKSKEIQSKVKK